MQTTTKSVTKKEDVDRIKEAIKVLLDYMRRSGAPVGSAAKLCPMPDLCLIIATGDSAEEWGEKYDDWADEPDVEIDEDDEDA